MTTPLDIRLHTLEEITDGFSDDLIIGTGGYGNVYKGVYNGDLIAVKLLHPVSGLDDELFNNEVGNLLNVQHPNIVKLRAYCHETHSKYVEHNGKNRLCKHIYRVLCFEYLQGGSLDKLLRDQSFAVNWSARYNIIKGICEGLNFLHNRCEPPIFHLDLKPANILLDSSMVPKVADFGLSRLFGGSHTHFTNRIIGTEKYMPPELINQGIISRKNDVFSLGVVIKEIVKGPMSLRYSEMSDDTQLMHEVHTNWKNIIEATSEYPSEEIHQVQMCIDIAVSCMEPERKNRPTIANILNILNKTETHIPKRQLTDVPMYLAIGPKNTLGNTLKTARPEQDSILNEDQNYSLVEKYSNSNVQQVGDIRETSSSIKETLIIGRNEEKQKILSILSESSTQEITFLPIYGIGGIGKTTMAQLVFNDAQFKEYSRVWIYVSQTFDLKKIGNSIITQLSGSKSKHTDLQMIENSLQKLLSGKRVLIILDDLWEMESPQLKKLECMLNLGEGGKVVAVITTREESVAQKIQTDTLKYKLAPLTDDICWTIIKNKSSFETRAERAQLELIGKEIAKKCGGLALATQSIGYMLGTMEFDEWVSVNNSEIWDVLALEESSSDHVHASLMLSYRNMNKYLRLCFAYCATFPKGYKIAEEDLAHQWIALGLVEPSSTFSYIQTSHKYISQLSGMSFLEHSRSERTKDVNKRFLIMHDLVHDLARSVLADENNIESPACQYAWLTDIRKLFKSPVNPLAKIRALHFLDRGNLQLHGEAFSRAECLCVLDLSRCDTQELPDSIGQLKELRYLDASWNIEGKGFWDSQEVHESMLIPKALGSLNKLQYLNLSRRRRPIGLPDVISKLTELRNLDISYCQGFYLVNSPSENQSFIDSIGTLPNLEQLDMSWNDYDFCVPESFSSLKKLNLSGCDKISSLPENLGKVDIQRLFGLLDLCQRAKILLADENMKGFHVRAVDSESSSSLVWLKHTNPDVLRIFHLENVMSVEEARSIRLMEKHRIEELSLQWSFSWSSSRGRSSGEHMELLTELVPPSSVKDFKIIRYRGVMFPHWFMHISKYLPNLVSLEMWDLRCSNLPTLVQLPNLRKIVLRHMPNLEEFNTTSLSEDGAEELTLAKLEHLEIHECPKLRIKPSPPRAVYCHISSSDRVLLSWGKCASSMWRWKADSSCSPMSKLKVEKSKLPLCKWRLLHHVTGLSDLTISDCNDLTISPQITGAFTSLESLSLESLSLKKLPEWLGELTSLLRLNLHMCYELPKLQKNMMQLTQLQSLSLHDCSGLRTLLPWLGEVTLLKTLEIRSCEDIISLPESILTNLEELQIWDCRKLYYWCKLEENQMKLTHIKKKLYRSTANEDEEDLLKSLGISDSPYVARGSEEENRSMKPMNTQETVELTSMKDAGDDLAASVHGTMIDDEAHQDVLYSTVMNVPGFEEEALLVALSHLMDNDAQGSAYVGMQEEQRVSWLMNFLKNHY